MIELPLVSVMCPTYNAEAYIASAMRSVLSQSYAHVQLVISDDASKDDTVKIVRTVAAEFPHRQVIVNVNEANLGITANCNVALNLCAGEYVCLFAGDDLFYPGKIAAQIEHFLQHPNAAISYHGIDIIDENDNKVATWNDTSNKYRVAEDVICNGGLPYVGSVMIKRSFIPAWGYDPALPNVSDWLFLIEVAIRGNLVRLDGIYAGYRRHSAGASRKTMQFMAESLQTLEIVRVRYSDPRLDKACLHAKRRYLLGEIARSTMTGNAIQLRRLKTEFLQDDFPLKIVCGIGALASGLHLHKVKLLRWIFRYAEMRVKS